MKHSLRSATLPGVIMLVVSAVVLAPVRPAPAPMPVPAVRLVAAVLPTQQAPQPPTQSTQLGAPGMLLAPPTAATDLPNLLVGWLERIIVPPSASAPFPQPNFPPVVAGSSIDSAIKNVYNAVEPWVQYGFELAAYAVGWVPYVGWLAPQVMIFYNLVERIVRSITFNIADWLGGSVSFWDGLANVVVDTVNSFIYFANDQIAFWLPPLPPLPPIGPFAAEDMDAGLMMASSLDESSELTGTENGEKDELTTQGDELTTQGDELTTQGDELTTQGDELTTQGNELTTQGDELNADGQAQIEVVTDEQDNRIDPDKIDAQGADDLTTTDSSGTIQAQGEIRESPVATPTGATSPQSQSPNGDPTEQTPTTPDVEPPNTADPDPGQDSGEGSGNTAGTE
ncbi:hypothetical protein AB4Z42_12890 [Mycobacterium sp. 2YAF39]|uniref:hypothetical protein n=1 Tax=Mycobacterium sp. 2YAF39 TaxID=3233033 RepID=UPI003F9E62B6